MIGVYNYWRPGRGTIPVYDGVEYIKKVSHNGINGVIAIQHPINKQLKAKISIRTDLGSLKWSVISSQDDIDYYISFAESLIQTYIGQRIELNQFTSHLIDKGFKLNLTNGEKEHYSKYDNLEQQ